MSKRLLRMIVVAAVAATVAAVVAGLRPGNALAWTPPMLTGTATCNTNTGNYDVTWHGTNAESKAFVVTSSNRSVVKNGDIIPAGGTKDWNESLPGNTTGTTTLNISGNYPGSGDPNTYSAPASITTDGKCMKPKPPCQYGKDKWGKCLPPPCQPTNGKDKWGKDHGKGGNDCTPPPTCQDTNTCTPPPPPPPPPSYCDTTPSVDVGVVKHVVGPSTYNVGDMITYTGDVTNTGPCDAKDVSFTDTLPSEMELLTPNNVTVPQGTFSVTGGVGAQTINWQIGTLAAGQDVKITIVVRADKPGVNIANTACQATSTPDYNMANNKCSTVYVTVSAPPVAATPPVTTKPAPTPKPKPHKPVVKHHPKPKPPVHKKPPVKKHHKAPPKHVPPPTTL